MLAGGASGGADASPVSRALHNQLTDEGDEEEAERKKKHKQVDPVPPATDSMS